ncbi:MAG TPA: hypothetical protein P5514_04085 [Bacteroidales bacterium]|nr:hypothetical protein [Bacteroidales bacterium]HRX96097.1 hypothetical protein [Bacteroidales bacterium]
MKSNYALLKAASLLLIFIFYSGISHAQTVSVTDDESYSPETSAMLDVKSTDKGMLIPRMTTTQRNSIATPADGLFVYDTDENRFYYYDGSNWVDMPTKNAHSTDTSFTLTKQLIYSGDAIVWDDARVPVTATTRGGSRDPDISKFKDNGSGSQGVFIYYFSAYSEEELYFTLQLPHSYKPGSDLEPHVHWVPSNTSGGGDNVSWGLEYVWGNVNEDFPTNTTIITGTSAVPTSYKQTICDLGTIDGTGKKRSSMLVCRIYRNVNGSDDYNSDAGLLEIDFHFQKDSEGTTTEY